MTRLDSTAPKRLWLYILHIESLFFLYGSLGSLLLLWPLWRPVLYIIWTATHVMLRVTPLTHPSHTGKFKKNWEKIFHLLVCTGQEKCRLNVLAEGENSSSQKFIFWLFFLSFLARLMCLLGLKQQRLIWKSVLCFCFLYLYTYGTVFVLARKFGRVFF